MVKVKLIDTVEAMQSNSYKTRFVAEYWQLKVRYEKLKSFNNRIEAAMSSLGKVDEPVHDCPAEMLRHQEYLMAESLRVLEVRAVIEGICLDENSLKDCSEKTLSVGVPDSSSIEQSAKSILKEKIMDNQKFIDLCKKTICDYANEHLDKTDDKKITEEDVFIVWICKTLQNNKALASTTLFDGMYYELTYNGDKEELYFDAYKKWENKCIKLQK